jgi:hypothetical protein
MRQGEFIPSSVISETEIPCTKISTPSTVVPKPME